MEHTPTDRPLGMTAATTGTVERTSGARHFRSLILPNLVSADALIPRWLRKLLRRKDIG